MSAGSPQTEDVLEALSVLGLDESATPDDVRRAYRRLCKVWHPDRFLHHPELRQQAGDQLRRVNVAYGLASAYARSPGSMHRPSRFQKAADKAPMLAAAIAGGLLLMSVVLTFMSAGTESAKPPQATIVRAYDESCLASVSPAPGHFFLGSTRDVVLEVMGAPDVANSSGDASGTYDSSWQYGSTYGSRVYFKDGKVVGYSDRDASVRLKVGTTIPVNAEGGAVTPGDTLAIVLAKRGVPQVAWLPVTGRSGTTEEGLLRYFAEDGTLTNAAVLDVTLASDGTVRSVE